MTKTFIIEVFKSLRKLVEFHNKFMFLYSNPFIHSVNSSTNSNFMENLKGKGIVLFMWEGIDDPQEEITFKLFFWLDLVFWPCRSR